MPAPGPAPFLQAGGRRRPGGCGHGGAQGAEPPALPGRRAPGGSGGAGRGRGLGRGGLPSPRLVLPPLCLSPSLSLSLLMFDPAAAPAGMSDGGAEPGRSPLLLAEPGAPGRAREKAPSREELENALRGGGGGFKDIPGTSAVSPGSSKECAPDTESPSGPGEADYCRRILVRGTAPSPGSPPAALPRTLPVQLPVLPVLPVRPRRRPPPAPGLPAPPPLPPARFLAVGTGPLSPLPPGAGLGAQHGSARPGRGCSGGPRPLPGRVALGGRARSGRRASGAASLLNRWRRRKASRSGGELGTISLFLFFFFYLFPLFIISLSRLGLGGSARLGSALSR